MTASPDLDVEDVTVRFGGLVAVDGVSIHAPGGTITGLIGPNGAGKTTTFNACTGDVASHGTVRLGGVTLHGPPSARAQAGLGRTFQRIELCESMDVRENVELGPDAMFAGRRPWQQLAASRRQRVDVRERAEAAMARCGIAHLADRNAGELSTGQRRLVELARALATGFTFLLLDEPSSGLDVGETRVFGEVLEDVLANEGTGILLVEHDMALVRAVCRTIHVLDFGKLVYRGNAADALSSDVVRAAYLGTEDVEVVA